MLTFEGVKTSHIQARRTPARNVSQTTPTSLEMLSFRQTTASLHENYLGMKDAVTTVISHGQKKAF